MGITMSKLALRALATSAFAVLAAAPAMAGSVSGTFNGQTWTAANTIVGVTGTGGANGGGDSRYFATDPKYRGVVTLIMQYATGSFICTGSLLADRVSVLTAGHCVSDGAGTANPLVTTAYFNQHTDPNLREFQSPTSTAITVSQYIVNEGYTGEVIDQNDIAIVRLSQAAPEWAVGYAIYDGGDLTGARWLRRPFGCGRRRRPEQPYRLSAPGRQQLCLSLGRRRVRRLLHRARRQRRKLLRHRRSRLFVRRGLRQRHRPERV